MLQVPQVGRLVYSLTFPYVPAQAAPPQVAAGRLQMPVVTAMAAVMMRTLLLLLVLSATVVFLQGQC